RQATGWQQGLPGAELASAAQDQHERRDSADLRVVDHLVSGDACAMVRPERRDDLAARRCGGDGTWTAGARNSLRCSDHLFLFFLYSAAVQPERDSGKPEEE